MKILLIGNGFDLEHGLPTKYTDFLEYIFNCYQNNESNKSSEKVNNLKEDRHNKFILDFEKREKERIISELITENIWVDYFKNAYEEHLKNKENWIDFEYEISTVIQSMEFIIKYNNTSDMNKYYAMSYEQCMERLSKFIPNYFKTENEINKTKNDIKLRIPYLVDDLNKLICALEIYICNHINLLDIQYYNPDIPAIRPDKVLSFNYSDTYRRLYETKNSCVEYHFIHGKAQNNFKYEKERETDYLKGITENNNMVLGIDEYLPQERRNKDIDFIQFKKYYQRIYKQTGNGYKQWLKEIDEEIEKTKKTEKTENVENAEKEDNILYIFGHSLDVTDGDILRDIINHNGVKTVIFYKNKKQLGQQIANLVKILGSDSLIQRVEEINPSIEFRLQSDRKDNKGSEFEIDMDMIKLRDIYKASQGEAELLVNKIHKKIKRKEVKYFFSQEYVIELFIILVENGLGNQYGEELLEIAKKLSDSTNQNKNNPFSYEQWNCQNSNNAYNDVIKKFIGEINKYNEAVFLSRNVETNGFDQTVEEYRKLINSNYVISKKRYEEIIRKIFLIMEFKENEFDELWKILVKISAYPAKRVFEETLIELRQNEKEKHMAFRYTRLLEDSKRMQIKDFHSKRF